PVGSLNGDSVVLGVDLMEASNHSVKAIEDIKPVRCSPRLDTSCRARVRTGVFVLEEQGLHTKSIVLSATPIERYACLSKWMQASVLHGGGVSALQHWVQPREDGSRWRDCLRPLWVEIGHLAAARG